MKFLVGQKLNWLNSSLTIYIRRNIQRGNNICQEGDRHLFVRGRGLIVHILSDHRKWKLWVTCHSDGHKSSLGDAHLSSQIQKGANRHMENKVCSFLFSSARNHKLSSDSKQRLTYLTGERTTESKKAEQGKKITTRWTDYQEMLSTKFQKWCL